MEFVAFDRVPPGPGQVEVAVSASSINFADVLVAIGPIPQLRGTTAAAGHRFRGRGDRGRAGRHRSPGRRPCRRACPPNGCWGTFVTCDARLAATLPPGLTDAQAASVTTAHATAWYGLHDLARIRAGDKVLIHSATGGVGQAAIAIARAAGAKIFATAGSPQRRALLHDMGIEHVYDSRSIEFAEQIRRDTDGYGVDIVLNSADRRRATCRDQAAGDGRTVRRDREARHLRRQQAGALPVPSQPVVLRRRLGVVIGHPPRSESASC